ncbi:MAG: PQQ-binding-like beta-propeller repeat protein [Deltaproteobacteria bacterium]|nr:PQQ-binding-like beta-propeller repeat protein [Deltaproteobacteria bacterium]
MRMRWVVLAAVLGAVGCGKNDSGSSSGSSAGATATGTSGSHGSTTSGGSSGATTASGSSTGTTTSSSSTASSSTSSTGSSSTGSSSTGGSSTGGTDPADVLMEHKDPHRTGLYVDAAFTASAVPNIHPDTAFDGTFTGEPYAQPLFVSGANGATDLVIVGTEENDVIAFNAATGAQVWTQNLGDPWPLNELSCGNISTNGITGTGVIDSATRTFYVDALVHNVGHQVFALDVDTGHVKSGWPVTLDGNAQSNGATFDIDPGSGNPLVVQQERAALALMGGKLYVPFGGFYGDCGPYHGWVIAIDPTNASITGAWATRATGGGIWAPSGIAVEGQGLFVSTGNTFVGGINWSDGEAVFDLGPDASFDYATGNYWAPTNWKALDDSDIDMSGTGPLIFDLGTLHAVLAMGKDGKLYLLDRDALGGISNALVTLQASSNEIINAAATVADAQGQMVFYVSNPITCPTGSGDLGAVRIAPGSPPTITPVWCGDEVENLPGGGSPIVTSPDGQGSFVVWGVGAGGDNKLRAWDAETGTPLFDGTGSLTDTVHRFQAPIVAKGRLYIAADNRLESYVLQ